MMHRRDALGTAIAAGTAMMLETTSAGDQDHAPRQGSIIDTNISLFPWPFRALPFDDPAALQQKLVSLGIKQAWAGSNEGILHRDVEGVNQRLADVCRQSKFFAPIGSVNVALPDWKHDLDRCAHHYKMGGIRVHPNYHQYSPPDPRFGQLLRRASAAGLLVQIAVALEDPRTQHSLVQVSDVDASELITALRQVPDAKVQVINHRYRGATLDQLAKLPHVYLDLSRVEGTDGVASLLDHFPSERVMFGTHGPLLIPESSLVRVAESRLDPEVQRQIMWANAKAIQPSQGARS